VTGDVSVNGGTLDIDNDLTINGGDLFNAGGTVICASTPTVTINNAGVLGGAGSTTLPRLTFDNAGTTTLGGNIVVVGSMTINSGHTLDANASPSYQITISSYWANQGTFNAQAGKVVFTSTAGISGNTTFNDFEATTAGITLTFIQGSTQTVSGKLNVAGAPGNQIKLWSSGASQFYFRVLVSTSASQVDVQNSKATGNTMYAGKSSTSRGTNTNWVFDYPPYDITTLNATTQPDGSVTLTWNATLDPDDNPLLEGSQFAIEWATYSVVWSTSNAGDTSSTNTWHVYIATSGVFAGDPQLYISTGLAGSVNYSFRIWTKDPLGYWSPISNSASAIVSPVLSVIISPNSYGFGSVPVSSAVVSTTAITVNNAGNVTQTYTLSVTTVGPTSVWSVGIATPTSYNTFVLFGGFNSAKPSSATFTSQDVITKTPSASTNQIFAMDQTGVSVPCGNDRKLWFLLDMPPTTSTIKEQQMDVTITATSP
jgi:hypothetical protein